MNKWENYKGLTWYMAMILVALSFYAYSQSVGWLWFGSTSTTAPAEKTGTHGRTTGAYRYLNHK